MPRHECYRSDDELPHTLSAATEAAAQGVLGQVSNFMVRVTPQSACCITPVPCHMQMHGNMGLSVGAQGTRGLPGCSCCSD